MWVRKLAHELALSSPGCHTRVPLVTFTSSGEAAIERLIEEQLTGVRDDILAALPRQQLDCLVLGGGYGRGEGGVLSTPEGPLPYNDYDIVLVHHMGDRRRLAGALQQIHETHSRLCGIHVDVLPLHIRRLTRLPPALTWYELAQGHVVLWGDESTLAPLLARRLDDVAPSEWGRLLVNRASGLLFASWLRQGHRCNVVGEADEPSFTTRQVFKAWLSLGDVLLADRGMYSPLVTERRKRFEALCARGQGPDWGAEYTRACEFKLRPQLRLDDDTLREHLERLRALYPKAMASHASAEPSTIRGLYGTLKFVPMSAWARSSPLSHPRERLRRAIMAEFQGQVGTLDRLTGGRAEFEVLWQHIG